MVVYFSPVEAEVGGVPVPTTRQVDDGLVVDLGDGVVVELVPLGERERGREGEGDREIR
jgi:hypothetical protein